MLEVLGRRRLTGVLAFLVAMVAGLGLVQAAQAGTLSLVGTTYVYTSLSATAVNTVDLDFCENNPCGGNRLIVQDTTDAPTTGTGLPSGCGGSGALLGCPIDGITAIRVELGGGDDTLTIDHSSLVGNVGLLTLPITAFGGAGDDSLTTTLGADSLDGGPGIDMLDGGSARDLIHGRDGNDTINGQTDVDTLFGDAGNDTINGGDGNDVIQGGSGADTISGDAGIDTASYDDHGTSGVLATLFAGASTSGNATDGPAGARDKFASVERLIGSDGADTLIGDLNGNRLTGGAGNDVLRGGRGNDELIGGSGIDFASYLDRTASAPVTASLDGVKNDGGTGEIDSFQTIEGIEGGAGNDNLSTTTAAQLLGGDGNDQITGSAGADTLRGGNGSDTINGRLGADKLFGDSGDDNIESRDGVVDTVDCGAGTADFNNADSNDVRSGCELPAPPVVTPPVVTPPVITPPVVNPPVATPPKIFDVTVSFAFFPLHPKKTTRFEDFVAKNVPKGTKIRARCVKAKNGKKCRGKLGRSMTIKKTKKKTNKLNVLNRKYPAGSNLEVTFTKKGFRTKIKVIKILKNKRPKIATLCVNPGSTKRKSC